MSERPGRKVYRLEASAENFAVAWTGQAILARGGSMEDGDVGVVFLRGDRSPGLEVVGRFAGGYLVPTYRITIVRVGIINAEEDRRC